MGWRLVFLIMAGGTLLAVPAMAVDPRVEAMGRTDLVLEEDTTVLSLFNFGNPAGAIFLPREGRIDVNASLTERVRTAEYATGRDPIVFLDPNSPASKPNYIVGDTRVDPFGNTLLPRVVYTRQARDTNLAFDDWENTGYGGYLAWLDEQTFLQIIPKTYSWQRSTTDEHQQLSETLDGGVVRSAWQISPGLGVGAGVSYLAGRLLGWPELDGMFTALTPPIYFLNHQDQLLSRFGLQLGCAWRNESVFDAKDQLDLGLFLHGTNSAAQNEDSSDLTAGDELGLPGVPWTRQRSMPWEVQLQGLYHYKAAMDIGLVAGYQNQEDDVTFSGPDGVFERRAEGRDNLDYELSFRVKLPMAREDDLRFGVVFNNRGYEHPFPSGKVRLYDADGLYTQPTIQTASSSIGIGMAIVPAEGALASIQYNLGSSKSSQENAADLLADSAFTRFGVGVQYSLLEGLLLRLGYYDDQVVFQEQKNLLSIETASLRFGLGLTEGPWRVDLTVIGERVAYSASQTNGWTMLDKPIALTKVDLDADLRLRTMLGLTWNF